MGARWRRSAIEHQDPPSTAGDLTVTVPNISLSDSQTIPQVGFGVFQVPDAETQAAVETALEVGYRHIDTASIYGNERGVGAALAASGLPRDEVFVTSKLWIDSFGQGAVRPALQESLDRLGVDTLDLYLIHWPAPNNGQYVSAWEQLLEARDAGLIRQAGVSNFTPVLLDELIAATGQTPAINQIQVNPALQQPGVRAYHQEHGIVTEAWSPIAQGRVLGDPVITGIATRLEVTPAQVILRWHIQAGTVIIPKSVHRERMVSNLDLFSFELTADDVTAIDALDEGAAIWDVPLTMHG